jgi:lipid-A-disaccharide synthase
MLAALDELGRAGMRIDARILAAASLDGATRRWLDTTAADAGVRTVDVDPDAGAGAWLGAFDAALSASGTATLECALSGAPPVVVYRLSRFSAAIARRFLRTPFVALPNVVLGAAVYPELLDRDVEPRRMARALAVVLERRATFEAHAQALRARLAWSPSSPRSTAEAVGQSSAERAASLLAPWLTLDAAAARGASSTAARTEQRSPTASPP